MFNLLALTDWSSMGHRRRWTEEMLCEWQELVTTPEMTEHARQSTSWVRILWNELTGPTKGMDPLPSTLAVAVGLVCLAGVVWLLWRRARLKRR
jgi:hypothetical protein